MVDLHVHSIWSDGEFSPRQLVEQAKAQGLTGLALTDHDTLAGLQELRQAGRELELKVYGGVEISCTEPSGRQLHLLVYDIPPEGEAAIEALCAPIRRSRTEAVLQAAKRLRLAGWPVTEEKILAQAGPGGDLCKQYVMESLIEAGCCDSLYGPLYRTLFKQAPDGSKGIAQLVFPTADPVEAVRCAVRAGGKAVLAHPGQYGNFGMLPELVEAGLWGIEVWHPKHSTELVDRCLKLAEEYQLACTGGSDFHGRYGEGETLGCCTAPKTDLHPL